MGNENTIIILKKYKFYEFLYKKDFKSQVKLELKIFVGVIYCFHIFI